PLSEERHYERGFNQAELLAIGLKKHTSNLLKRKNHEEKQSKKSRNDRLQKKENPFEFVDEINAMGKKFVLVDDVYTTGSTIRYAAMVLLEAGAREVSSITLAR
uniref:ComF family protein n=1 Tax=Peribacillus alkalitolerans TaxID=1550385 RepID=UPI0013D4F33D